MSDSQNSNRKLQPTSNSMFLNIDQNLCKINYISFVIYFLFLPRFVLFQFISIYFFDKMLCVVLDAPRLIYYGTHL